MSTEVMLRGFFCAIFALSLSWGIFSRYDDEIGSETNNTGQQKYLPLISMILLPVFLLSIMILGTWFYDFSGAVRMALSTCFTVFVHVGLYFLILILALPFLRRFISARACAMLWLIPNYLYIMHRSFMELPSPLLVITAPGSLAWLLLTVWLAGFVGVMLWKIIDHLVFRHRVLAHTVPDTDPNVLALWNKVIRDAQFKKPKFQLVISPNISTPLTIGLFQKSTRVVLPERKYAQDDLELILRHEIVHIGREDAWSKFFMVFCTAICWFNPLMWIAMRKSADDLELSCDETVLLNADDVVRKQYAILLLDTAGDERGFTTCLSASAKAMRYRLKSITKPARKHSGALVVGAVFFLLSMTCGYVSLAYDGDSGAEMIYNCDDLSKYSIRYITMADDEFHTNFEIADEQAFHEYLAGLTLYDLTGNYSFSDSKRSFTYLLDSPDGTMSVILYDQALKVVHLNQLLDEVSYYYIPEGIDWDYLSTIIIAHPAMNIYLTKDGNDYGQDVSATLCKLWRTTNGERTLVHEDERPNGDYGGIYGYEPNEGKLTFSYELAAPSSVLVESWDYTESHTIYQTDLTQPYTVDIPNFPAHYTVYASFYDQTGNLYEAEFRFNIGSIDSV